MGLREEKKKKTRKAISNMATLLFVERGYHAVTTAEIAERAEVSVPTLFNYFPTKEALVFDEDAEIEERLVASVVDRKKGVSVHAALLEGGLAHIESLHDVERKSFDKMMALIDGTPELSAYWKQMWMRHEQALAKAIRKESRVKLSALESEAIARFVLDAYHRSLPAAQPKAAMRALFALLGKGWAG